jgi:hypothetical protein
MRKETKRGFLQSRSVMSVEGYSSDSETQTKIENRKIVFNGSVYTVLRRKKGLDKKPPYYLLDLDKKLYLSSLYPTGQANTYVFDVRGGDHYIIRFTPGGYEIERIK